MDDLAAKNAAPRAAVAQRSNASMAQEDTREERRLLLGSMHSLMQWMSGYGKAVFMDDEDGLRRWRLDRTYAGGGIHDSTTEPVITPPPA